MGERKDTEVTIGVWTEARPESRANDTLLTVTMAISPAATEPTQGSLRHLLRAVRRFVSPRRIAATWRFLLELGRSLRRRRAEPRLTVAVDINSFYEPLTGVGWYLRQLLAELADRQDLRLRLYGQSLCDEGDAPQLTIALPEGPALERIVYRAPDHLVVPPWRAHQLLRRLAPLLTAADGNRVLFAPNYLAPRLFRFSSGARVAMIHDLAIDHVGWTVRPDSAVALASGLERSLFEAARLLTPSEAVRRELLARGIAPERVVAIHHGPGQPAGGGELPPGTPSRYVLFVGTLEPRKNLPVLLAAWRQLRAGAPDTPALVLAGGQGWGAAELRAAVARAEDEGWVVALGYVPASALSALYRQALALALPSLYEGFGLPVVEALAAGTPMLLSDLPVLREVAGDAALYAPADDPQRWAEQARRLLGDPDLRAALAQKAARRRQEFDWRKAAAATASVWRGASGMAREPEPAHA
jgi:glycosyltransferase involved in cell wall biosynthesis